MMMSLSTTDCTLPRRGWWMKLKIGSAGLGLVMGALVFVIFAFIYGELSYCPRSVTTSPPSQVTSRRGSGLPCPLSSQPWSSINISCSPGEPSRRSTIQEGIIHIAYNITFVEGVKIVLTPSLF